MVEVVDDHGVAVHALLAQLPRAPDAVGHRLVHGGRTHAQPVLVDDAVRRDLDQVVALAPLHLPSELAAIDAVRTALPAVPQVACFDTAFHRAMPEVARRYALPSRCAQAGVARYGFHGLSYEYVASTLTPSQLGTRDHRAPRQRREPRRGPRWAFDRHDHGVFAERWHRDGHARRRSRSRAARVPARPTVTTAARLERLVDHEAGLLALSGTTADMRVLLAARERDPRAALAIDVFCYSARKAIGAFAAVLAGVDTLVFTGGIGEHAAAVRAQICQGLGYLGVAIESTRNAAHGPTIGAGRCDVRVIATDEERVVARATARVLRS